MSWLFPWKMSAQSLSGKIFTLSENGDTTVVYMARLQWLNTAVGAYSDVEGSYHLPFAKTDTLIIRYSFYKADTVVVSKNERHRDFFINTSQALQEVVVSKKRHTSAKGILPSSWSSM